MLIWRIFRAKAKVCVWRAKQEVHSSGTSGQGTNIPHRHNKNHSWWKILIQHVHNTMADLPMLLGPLCIARPWQMCFQCLLWPPVIYERGNDQPIDAGVHQCWQLLLEATSESELGIWPYDSWNQPPRQKITLSDVKSVVFYIRGQYWIHLFCGSSQTTNQMVSSTGKKKKNIYLILK